MQPSAGLRAERQVGQLFDCKYGRHGYVRRRLAFVGLLVPLTSKTLFSRVACLLLHQPLHTALHTAAHPEGEGGGGVGEMSTQQT